MRDIAGVRTLVLDPAGPTVSSEAAATDIVGMALGDGVDLVAIPVGRLDDEFFTLRSGLAGAVVQKFVTYHLTLVVFGDIAQRRAASPTLDAFVGEANRGRHTWFVSTLDDLERRLTAA